MDTLRRPSIFTFSQEEVKKYIEAFKKIDTNHDQWISSEELFNYFKAGHIHYTEEEFSLLIDHAMRIDLYKFLLILHRIRFRDSERWKLIENHAFGVLHKLKTDAMEWFGLRSEQHLERAPSVFWKQGVSISKRHSSVKEETLKRENNLATMEIILEDEVDEEDEEDEGNDGEEEEEEILIMDEKGEMIVVSKSESKEGLGVIKATTEEKEGGEGIEEEALVEDEILHNVQKILHSDEVKGTPIEKEPLMNVEIPMMIQSTEENKQIAIIDKVQEKKTANTDSKSPRNKVDESKRKKKKKKKKRRPLPKALKDPKVIAQLKQMKKHRPYFIILVSLVNIALMIYAIVYNKGFESMSVNPMGGISSMTMIRLGAKYVPCMRINNSVPLGTHTLCPLNYTGPIVGKNPQGDNICDYYQYYAYICGMGGFPNGVPDQWWRFFTCIFLHVGLIHLALNLSFQLVNGILMERSLGWLRIGIIYISTGIAGNLFGALMAPKQASAGASASLYGMMGVMYMDLFQNWKIIHRPWLQFWLLTITVVISLGIGLLPFIDNYAHIGGFITGILAGLIFVPTITFGKWDARRKLIALIVAIPLFVGLFILGFLYFYVFPVENFCHWCRWFNCIPPDSDWCTHYTG